MTVWVSPHDWVGGEGITEALLDEISGNLNYLKTNIALGTPQELTIATGAITKLASHHTVDTEGDAASDYLATITGGADGELLLLRAAHTDRTVIIDDGADNIETGAGDITLDDTDKFILLYYNSAKWVMIAGGVIGGYTDAMAVDAVEAAGVDLASGVNIKLLAALTGDHEISSADCEDATAGENLVFGDFCYLKGDGKLWKADASVVTTMPCLYMAAATILADASGVFLRSGIARDDSWTWSDEGVLLYTSITGGQITETAPSVTGEYVQPVGIAINATHIDFRPSMVLIKVA